jgi:hypothetical protein
MTSKALYFDKFDLTENESRDFFVIFTAYSANKTK